MDIKEKVDHLENLLIKLLKNQVVFEGAYLAGGTAIFYYIHHRYSLDLDFFSPKPFYGEIIINKLKNLISEVELEIFEKDTLIATLTPAKLRFSLFHFPYNFISPPNPYEISPGLVFPLASLDDIEAMKAVALVQRGSAKDFIDLYYLLKHTGHLFSDLAGRVHKKYSVDEKYDYHLRTALVYFDDAERELEAIWLVGERGRPRPITAEEWSQIKDFFESFGQ